MSKPTARSMAFDEAGNAYVLMRQDTAHWICRLGDDDTLAPIRKVGKAWWLRVLTRGAGVEALLRDDDGVGPINAFALDDQKRGRKLAAGAEARFYAWHRVAATLPGARYLVGVDHGTRVYRVDDDGLVNLDDEPAARSEAERAARFYLTGRKGLFARRLDDAPGRWTNLFPQGLDGCKQIAYDAVHDEVVTAGSYRGSGQAHFADGAGKVRVHRSRADNGFWSVATLGGRVFVYDFHGVVELGRDGSERRHPVDGQIARNQCLFATGEALYFVCSDRIHCLQGDAWRAIEVGARPLPAPQKIIVAPTPAEKKRDAAVQADSNVGELRARAIAGSDNIDALRSLSDRLLEHGDPRGELIALQLVDNPSKAQLRRVEALIKANLRAWLGPLHDAMARGSAVFRRGFVRELGLEQKAAKQVAALRGAEAWATVERLDVSMWPDDAVVALLGDPLLDNLRHVEGIHHAATLSRLGARPWTSLGLSYLRRGDIAELVGASALLPALRHLETNAQDMPSGELRPLWSVPLIERLETLVLRPQNIDELAPRWNDVGSHLLSLTLLPGGMDRGGGWQLTLTRDAPGGVTRRACFDYHWPISSARALPRRQYVQLAALMRALPAFGAEVVEVEPLSFAPTAAQYRAIAEAARALKR
ncbi:MAG: hypothetical protein KC503_47205 [Myxococcales bacterium]|nr:hypothetical protein [Myxococcales bacterium]